MIKKIKEMYSLLKWDSVFTMMVLGLTIPMFFQNLVSQLLNLIDNLMVSQLGDAAYAGIAQANRYSMVAHVMLFGVSSGTSIFVSQFWGARQIDNMKKANGLGMTAGLLISSTLMLIALFASEQVMALFLAPGESLRQGALYLRSIAFMFPLVAVANSHALLLRCEEKTKYPMFAGMIAVAINTVLNFLLIEGHFGFPRWEVLGAGVATVISALIQVGILIYFARRHSQSGKATLQEFFGFDFSFVKKFAKTATPVMVNEAFWSVGIAMLSVFYGLRGDVAVAAVGVFNSIDSIAFITIYSLTNATGVIVGKALGAGDGEDAMLYAKRLAAGTIVLALGISILIFIFADPIVGIFGKLSPEALESAKKLVRISALFIWGKSFNSILVVGILRAGGDTVMSLILDVVFLWCVAIPLVGLAANFTNWPIHVLYMLTLSDNILKFIFGTRRFRSRKWIKNLTNA